MPTVLDGTREVRFNGNLIGSATSHRPGKSRWNEIEIYRTTGGKYIVAGIGRTLNEGESDRHWTHVCESPSGVRESLYLYDNDNVRYLTRTAQTAINQACSRDEGLRLANQSEWID